MMSGSLHQSNLLNDYVDMIFPIFGPATYSPLLVQVLQGTIQVLRQQRGGWSQKMAIFADLQYYLY